ATPGPHDAHSSQARAPHTERAPSPVVVRSSTPAAPVHVGAPAVHLAGMDAADLGAAHLVARARRAGWRVERTQPGVGLPDGILVDAGAGAHAAVAATARGAARVAERSGPFRPGPRWRRLIVVLQACDIGAAVAPELG